MLVSGLGDPTVPVEGLCWGARGARIVFCIFTEIAA